VHRVGFYSKIFPALFIKVVVERELSPSAKSSTHFHDHLAIEPLSVAWEGNVAPVDSAQLLGNLEDVNLDDHFILRRAISYRSSSSASLSAPWMNCLITPPRESASGSSISSDAGLPTKENRSNCLDRNSLLRTCRFTRQQKSILSAQTNSVREWNVLLPGNAMLRSSRYDAGDKMRYSYVEPTANI